MKMKIISLSIKRYLDGGFSRDEVEFAEKNNYRSVTLGKRILRSETACIYALSVLSYLVEDL